MVQAACEAGAGNVTVAHVVGRAGVSRRTFYEIFDSCEDCLLAALEQAADRLTDIAQAAYEKPGDWRKRTRAALTELLVFFDENPELARFLVVETLAAGVEACKRRQQILTAAIEAVEEGAGEASRNRSIPPLAGEAIVGAVLAVVYDRLLRSDAGNLVELTNPLMSTIVLPYLGAGAARRELRQPLASSVKIQGSDATVRPDAPERPQGVFPRGQIRLTYRTVRTLEAVAAHPGASNRRIADAAGVADPGQISKLLARLHKLGLVRNGGEGGVKGEPNAWMLTPVGQRMHQTTIGR